MTMDIYLMDEEDTIKNVIETINKTDGDKLRMAKGTKKEEKSDDHEESNTLEFQSKRVWNLKRWGEKNTKEMRWYTYPKDSASNNYVNVMDTHFTAKYELLKSGRKGKIFDAPWSKHLVRFFEWKPETLNHDLIRISTRYPEVRNIEMIPTPEQVYS